MTIFYRGYNAGCFAKFRIFFATKVIVAVDNGGTRATLMIESSRVVDFFRDIFSWLIECVAPDASLSIKWRNFCFYKRLTIVGVNFISVADRLRSINGMNVSSFKIDLL